MNATIKVECEHVAVGTDAETEVGSVTITRDDGKTMTSTWTVSGGRGSGFDGHDGGLAEEIDRLNDEFNADPDSSDWDPVDLDELAQAACDAFWGSEIPTENVADDVIRVRWADLVGAVLN